jgi:hypothetical protein
VYSHPNVKYPRFGLGDIVEHKYRPGVLLSVVSGPHKSLSGWGYVVEHQGKLVPVLEKNLKS